MLVGYKGSRERGTWDRLVGWIAQKYTHSLPPPLPSPQHTHTNTQFYFLMLLGLLARIKYRHSSSLKETGNLAYM